MTRCNTLLRDDLTKCGSHTVSVVDNYNVVINILAMPSPTRELIEIQLGATKRKSLTGLVRQGRQAGHGWRKIADAVSRESGIPVSHTTIARWFENEAVAS
jgi:hypothetical protein